MSGQYIKPKKMNDHREVKDLRSKTPFSSSTRINSPRGLRSGKVRRAGAKMFSAALLRDCHSVQYPDPANAKPTAAALINAAAMSFSRAIVLTTDIAPHSCLAESDNWTPLTSIMPVQRLANAPRSTLACITMWLGKRVPPTLLNGHL